MQKVILKLDVHDEKTKQKAMGTVSSLSGVNSISMDMKGKKLTVRGDVDPVNLVNKLRKICHTEMVSMEQEKEKKKLAEPKKEEQKNKEPTKEESKKKEPKKTDEKKKEPKRNLQEGSKGQATGPKPAGPGPFQPKMFEGKFWF